MTREPGRRGLAAGALSLLAAAALPARAAVPGDRTLLVPGPEGGGCALWAARTAAGLSRGLPGGASPALLLLGGPDGVTAANRFATLSPGDGRTLLVLPGEAVAVRLTGASRARFEPEAWVPLLAAWHGAVLAGRGPLPPPRAAPLRIALPARDAPEHAALAALDALGRPARPLLGAAPLAALAAGESDALLLRGPDPLAEALSLGLVPWCRFPAPGEAEGPLPSFAALAPPGPAAEAARAAVAAQQLRRALVLPALTAADAVAVWRRAAQRWQAEEERGGPALALVGAEAAAALSAVTPPPEALLSYRAWLDARLGWRPA